jgi:hypothetical protein
MGEYAEMAMERDLEAQFHPDEYDYLDGVVIRSPKPKTEIGLPYANREVGEAYQVRQFEKNLTDLRINVVCIIIRETEKAVLFKVDREYEVDLDHDITFWLPKSVLYLKENEVGTIYTKYWATINGADELAALCK